MQVMAYIYWSLSMCLVLLQTADIEHSQGCEMALFLMKSRDVSKIKLFFKAIEELRVQRNLKITKLQGGKSLLGEQKLW